MLEPRRSTTASKPWVPLLPGGDPLEIPIDPNGNLASKTEGTDTWAYTWNAENQLTKVEKNGAEVARFAYDPIGRRVEKAASGVTTSYVYDLAMIMKDARGATILRYVHGPTPDEPLAIDDGTGMSYLHTDALGSIVKATNAAGGVILSRQYDAWGNLEAGAGESGSAFTGREWDPEPGLYYYRARYYEPRIGRFISEDPIGFFGGVNFYTYVDDGPVTFIDPTGLLKPGPLKPPPVTMPTGGAAAGSGICQIVSTTTTTMGLLLLAANAGTGSDFAPGEPRPPTCDKTNTCDRKERDRCDEAYDRCIRRCSQPHVTPRVPDGTYVRRFDLCMRRCMVDVEKCPWPYTPTKR